MNCDSIFPLTPLGRSCCHWVPLGALGYWLQFYLGWEEGGSALLQAWRITTLVLNQTQSWKAESEFGAGGNWKGRRGWGSVKFCSEMENHHQK